MKNRHTNNPYLNDLVGLIIKRGMQLFLVMFIPGIAIEALFYFMTFSDETTFEIRRYAIIVMMLVFWVLIGKDRFKKNK